ncbi:hypothetical protein ACTSKR_03295 [Chitinibacteraceae bacterium HSL-7]
MHKLLFSLTLLASSSVFAQRTLPATGTLGELEAYTPTESRIDDKVYHNAPGLRIFSTQNTLIMPAQVPQKVKVWYQIETNTGFLWRMWVLSKDEYDYYRQLPKAQQQE